MERIDFTITSPERNPGEPDCAEQQRQYGDHLPTDFKADDLRAPLDALGRLQASYLIDRLKVAQTSVLAPIAFFVAGLLTLASMVFFIE